MQQMTYEQKRRLILLRAFAEADEEFARLYQKTADVDDLLMELRQELTEEQMQTVQKITGAYMNLCNHTMELACKYMIFPGENQKK